MEEIIYLFRHDLGHQPVRRNEVQECAQPKAQVVQGVRAQAGGCFLGLESFDGVRELCRLQWVLKVVIKEANRP